MGFRLQALVDKRFKNHWTTLVHFTGKNMEATRLAQGRQVSVLGMWLPRKPVGRWLRWDLAPDSRWLASSVLGLASQSGQEDVHVVSGRDHEHSDGSRLLGLLGTPLSQRQLDNGAQWARSPGVPC